MRWNKCAGLQGKYAGLCGSDRFYVCCLLTLNNQPEESVKGPAPPYEYLVATVGWWDPTTAASTTADLTTVKTRLNNTIFIERA